MTGQNPQSATGVAREVLAVLSEGQDVLMARQASAPTSRSIN